MGTFNLQIATPEGVRFAGEAESLLVRTADGDVEILKGHTELLASVLTGRVRIKTKDGERFASAAGGFLRVSKTEVCLAVTTFEFADEIDLSRAQKAKDDAEELLKSAKDDGDVRSAEAKLARALCRIKVAGM